MADFEDLFTLGVGAGQFKEAERNTARIIWQFALASQSPTLRALVEALKEARQTHYSCEDSWYSCPKSADGCVDDRQPKDVCNCGADDINAKIDAALALAAELG